MNSITCLISFFVLWYQKFFRRSDHQITTMSDQEVQQLSAKKRSSHQQEEEEEEQQPSAKKKRIDTTMSDLPREILPIIFRKLTDHDMLVCAQVCVTWESEVRSILPQYLLLTNLSEELRHPNNQVQHSFITLFNTHIQEIRKIHLPKLFLEGRYFSSSSFGWDRKSVV